MAGLLKKSEERAPKKESDSNKGSVWLLKPEDPLGACVADLVKLGDEARAIEGKIEVLKTRLKEHGERSFLASFLEKGSAPDTPMVIQNADGQSVTFVLNDRSSQHKVKPDQMAELNLVLGPDAAAKLVFKETTFKLNPELMAVPGVSDAVEKALEAAVKKLVQARTITAKQAEDLVEAEVKQALRPKLLDRMTEICGKDLKRMAGFLAALGGAVSRYIKV